MGKGECPEGGLFWTAWTWACDLALALEDAFIREYQDRRQEWKVRLSAGGFSPAVAAPRFGGRGGGAVEIQRKQLHDQHNRVRTLFYTGR